MPIEFPCPQCEQLLRVPDGSDGKQAKCPSCENLVRVPVARAPDSSSQSPSEADRREPVSGGSTDETTYDAGPAPEDTPRSGHPGDREENPYQSPQVTVSQPAWSEQPGSINRDGPPWERDGYSIGSFWQTVKLVVGSASEMFKTMRLEGGLGAPLLFALVGGLAGNLVSSLWGALFNMGVMSIAGVAEGNVNVELVPVFGGQIVASLAQGLCVGLVFIPISIFVGAGLVHLVLMMMSAANRDYEATFRVIAYSNGAVQLFNIVPIAGPIIGIVFYFIATITGIAESHGITGGKAAVAVVTPMLLCCCLGIGIGIALAGTVATVIQSFVALTM